MNTPAYTRVLFCILSLACSSALWAAFPQPIGIKVTKKTADVRQNTDILKRNVSVVSSSKDIFYRIELMTMSPSAPTNVIVKWVVVVETEGGRIVPGTRGEEEIALVLGRPTIVDTEDVSLESREVHVRGRIGERESEVYGYGIRVCDAENHILSETYEPKRAERELVAEFDRKVVDREKNRRDKRHESAPLDPGA